MKKYVQFLVLITALANVFFGAAQSSRSTNASIIHYNSSSNDSTIFEVVSLIPSDPDAWFMHLWWSGDNGFSFAEKPKHNHIVPKGSTAQMIDISTENYGTGGPPPLTYTLTTEHQGSELPKVLGTDTFLYVQNYRNAVRRDVTYLIITYGNSTSDTIKGKLRVDVGAYAEVCDSLLYSQHYFPNGERWDPVENEITYHNLGPDEERSLLIPVYIKPNEKQFLDMKVTLFNTLAETYTDPNGDHQFVRKLAVADSHDPNMMIAQSDAKSNCDYRGGNIHYTVKFQNDGKGKTEYVRVECHLDDKLDLETIENVRVPVKFFGQGCRESNATQNDVVRGAYEANCGAIWHVDHDRRILIVEMHDIKLYSSIDGNLPRIDMARGQIEFDVKVKDDYIFGSPVLAHSDIFFDHHGAIVTNTTEVGCDQPIAESDGGGYQNGMSCFVQKWVWWISAGLLAIILLLIILLIRERRKRRKLQKA
ncbi:MAG: hypothetical protein HWE22_07220 [Flavobacteriales bacterium]|nr:hypothetical protein [Flavobacteriales bacterium]